MPSSSGSASARTSTRAVSRRRKRSTSGRTTSSTTPSTISTRRSKDSCRPRRRKRVVGTVEVREIFKVPKIGNIAGCHVQDGKIVRNNRVRLVRDGIQIFEGAISSLKRFKDDVREVEAGFECGIGLENFNDMKVGDVIEAYRIVESKRKLIT